MEINAASALIAAGVALIVGLLTFLASRRAIQSRLQVTKLELEERYRKALFDHRLDCYKEAWKITGTISSRLLATYTENSRETVLKVLSDLDTWYNQTAGGLVLSKTSRERFFELRELSNELSEENSTKDWYDKVYRHKMDFRISLRADILIEEGAYRHTQEEWSLD